MTHFQYDFREQHSYFCWSELLKKLSFMNNKFLYLVAAVVLGKNLYKQQEDARQGYTDGYYTTCG